ncbi:hypothetical protein [Mesonia mobilis]|uniref:hypothetical protein n=1 Tax=Mesonia mobilis TaxID=369791 RepID=UPI0024B8922F|nr:hypothetical protein [Mesonia mobilis]
MSYKVDYIKLAIMPDGTTGNINQGGGVFYTDENIEKIPELVNKVLEKQKRKAIIQKITKLEGKCLFS